MKNNVGEQAWLNLPNPFNMQPPSAFSTEDQADINEAIIGHVSGRSTDIAEIITGAQSAIILAGAPNIGKTTLIRYLQSQPETGWSWRDEFANFRDQLRLNDIHFVQIDLRQLEEKSSTKELYNAFVEQCTAAVQAIYQPNARSSADPRVLRALLSTISQETPQGRCFIMLDNIESLGRASTWFDLLETSTAKTPQERGIALLDHCDAIRTLVDLIDEFTSFGVIFAIESLARSSMGDQFVHVSADLARFTTMTLQVFTWDDAQKFLVQGPESFGATWASTFKKLDGNSIFSENEQKWILEQAGLHPYLLQQFCFYHFRLKREYANIHHIWAETLTDDGEQIIERINERLSAFLPRMWQRLNEAILKTSRETRALFYTFIKSFEEHSSEDTISPGKWNELGQELRYILYSEGVVRYDPFQPIHYPGAILRNYLLQKAREYNEQSAAPSASDRNLFAAQTLTGTRGLNIGGPGNTRKYLSLSEREYDLFKTLLQHPERCTEEELMQGAWGKKVEHATFTQRIHHLRKKLKDQCGEEIIENRYGGIYLLKHPEWFQLT